MRVLSCTSRFGKLPAAARVPFGETGASEKLEICSKCCKPKRPANLNKDTVNFSASLSGNSFVILKPAPVPIPIPQPR